MAKLWKEEYAEAFKKGKERGNAITEMRITVAERLRTIRMQHGYTQKDIADLANINQTTYSGYENKISQPTVAVLTRIADVYDVSLDYLAGRTDNIYGLYATAEHETDSSRELVDRMKMIEEELTNLKNKIK